MSGITRSTRWLSTTLCSALLVSTVTVTTATAQSSSFAGSSELSSGSSTAGSSIGADSCSAVGNETCTVSNGSVEATVAPLVGHTSVSTTLTITGLRETTEDVAVSYSADGLENIRVDSDSDKVSSTEASNAVAITVAGGLAVGETVSVTITADLMENHEGPRPQSLSITSETSATSALNTLPGLVFAALGVYALIEHAHNMHWIPREVDQLLYELTGRDPELSRIQWTWW